MFSKACREGKRANELTQRFGEICSEGQTEKQY
jgi:hypothetical protein